MWDTATGEEEVTFTDHTNIVNNLSLTKDGRYLISASDDRTVRVWDLGEEEAIAIFQTDGEVLACDVTEDGTIIVGCINGRVHFLRLEGINASL